eukprot:2816224-Karenia_brevis.AAC.1
MKQDPGTSQPIRQMGFPHKPCWPQPLALSRPLVAKMPKITKINGKRAIIRGLFAKFNDSGRPHGGLFGRVR